MNVSGKELGRMCAAITKVADAISASGGLIDLDDADLQWARSFAASQATGVGSSEWFEELLRLKHAGCTCKPRMIAHSEGGFDAKHHDNCALLLTPAWEAEERRKKREQMAQRPRSTVLPWHLLANGGRR